MEMAETRLTAALLICASCICCSVPGKPEGASVGITWTKYQMDGSRTGVTACMGDDVETSLGRVEKGVYFAPNGRTYNDSVIAGIASRMISVQPRMAYLKKQVANSKCEMRSRHPQSLLSNWTADVLREGVETITGRKTDVSIINFGGIRQSMPEGAVLYDDIVSMFPFTNCLCWVQLKGDDLEYLFSDMVRERKLQAFSGAKLVVESDSLVSIEVGGGRIDPGKLYGVGTVDFLIDGGDRINVARNAVDLVISPTLMKEWFLEYVKGLTARGLDIESAIDDRITVLGK